MLDFYARLPRKRMAAGALFLDENGYILIVKPTYQTGWLLPGGVIELDESPARACAREVEEELSLRIHIERLLCVDYTAKTDEKSESLQFIFQGGTLNQEQIASIILPETELSAYRFVKLEEAISLLDSNIALRLPSCLEALEQHTAFYLEQGRRIG
jgi:ADP-ribose pyrophosphatase YjhB (NUDIX family)